MCIRDRYREARQIYKVEESSIFNLLKSELQSFNPFQKVSATNKDGVVQFRPLSDGKVKVRCIICLIDLPDIGEVKIR